VIDHGEFEKVSPLPSDYDNDEQPEIAIWAPKRLHCREFALWQSPRHSFFELAVVDSYSSRDIYISGFCGHFAMSHLFEDTSCEFALFENFAFATIILTLEPY